MIIPYRSNDRKNRNNDIGCIESPAYSRFDYSKIHRLITKIEKGHRSQYIKKRQFWIIHFSKQGLHSRFWNHFSIDLNPFSVREKIKINGEMIPESAVETLLAEVYDPELSFFDVLTSMAFLYFRNESVDFAVIEAGIGGRFDATNVIIPVLSIITSIGYDHLEQLGPTLEEVAEEKGGIIKPHVPCLVGPTAAPFFPNAPTILREPFFELENRSLAKQALKMLSIDSEA